MIRGLVLLGPALLAVAVRLLTGPHPIDDAYITFRYARNLADGLGLVYNPGEWVLGTTTPAWAAVLAAGYRLGAHDLPALASALSALSDALSAGLLAAIGLRLGWRAWGAALLGIAWAINPMSIAFAAGGMETSLFVLIELTALSLAVSRRMPVAAALAGIGTLVRPEGGLLVVAIVGWTWMRRPRQVPLAGLAGGLPILAMGAWFFEQYGSPLPHSIAAKQVAYQPAWPFENLAALLIQAGLPGWSTYLLAVLPPIAGVLLAVGGLAALLILVRHGLPRLHQRGVAWQPFAGFAVLYVAFYTLVGLRGVRLFPWYLVPIAPMYLLGAAAGLARWPRLAWLPLVLVLWQLPAIDWRQPFLPAGQTEWREQVLLDVGQELAATLPPGAVVAAPEIGALGYASNLRILDTVGLVSPAALPYYPLPADELVTDNAIPARLIQDQRPDVVVTMDAFAQRSLLADPAFLRDYRLERTYAAPVWQSQSLLMFRRADVASVAGAA